MGNYERYRDVIRQGREEIAAWKADVERFRAAQRARWETLAGSDAVSMLAAEEAAVAGLRHADAGVREAAIHILSNHWNVSGPEFASRFAKMAAEDPVLEVRALALVAMSACLRESQDQRNGRLLASIVRDESQAMEFREAAYIGLHILAGKSLPVMSREYGQQVAPFVARVDWGFVDTFLERMHG